MNLIRDEWIPARRRSGKVERIAPWQLTDSFSEDPFIGLAAPRPDFNGALIQFLIGLLQTCIAPEDVREWRNRLRRPPASAELKDTFLTDAYAFELDGEGPRFMQDLDLETELRELKPADQKKRISGVGNLLIEIPTGKTLEDNTDLFVKRGCVQQLCLACSAAAIFTMQTNAPSGGQGNRTGIRGGGPLTTLVLADSLWATCWLAVLVRGDFLRYTGNVEMDSPEDRFPWLAPTRTSEEGRGTSPQEAHPAQVYWAMPRRVRLLFCESVGTCDLCGMESTQIVRQAMTKNLGVNYEGPWKHPLSPYFVAKDGTPSPVHPQPGGIGYRHWLGLVQSSDDGRSLKEPAAVVTHYLRYRTEDLRIWAFGYDMDNMKARCWYDRTMPVILCLSAIQEDFQFHVAALVRSAELAASEIRVQLRKALFKAGSDVKGDLSFITERFWQETEPEFFILLPILRETLGENADSIPVMGRWHRLLVQTAERIYDDVSQAGAFEAADPKRIALAWRDLRLALFGNKMKRILGLPERDRPGGQKKGGKRTDV